MHAPALRVCWRQPSPKENLLPSLLRARAGLAAFALLSLAFRSPGPVGFTATVTAASVFARAAPDATATAVASLFRGQAFPALARTERGDWIQVNYSGARLWIPAWTAALNGQLLNLPVTAQAAKPPPGAPAPPESATPAGPPQPSLADFWEGRAERRA